MRLRLGFLIGAAVMALSSSAWADKIAVLPFRSSSNLPKPDLDQVRDWTRLAVMSKGHVLPTNAEMVSAEMAVKDGVADTSQEFRAAGRASGSAWTLTGTVEPIPHSAARLPDGTDEPAYTTYRVELEACQVETGRVESLAREVLPDEGPNDIGEMVALLARPEGLANAPLPWEKAGPRKPKGKAKPPGPPPPPPPPPAPPTPRRVYGQGYPIAIGAAAGVTDAVVRPSQARGPALAMPVGGIIGYALDAVPGLELRGNVTAQVLGPKAVELSAGARYAFNVVRGVRLFVGPELLIGAHIAVGADKTARFLAHGAGFVAFGITDQIQVEAAGDVAGAFGGTGSLVLVGGTGRFVVRF